MNKKIIILGLALALLPATANARGVHTYHAHKAVKFSRTIPYKMTMHRETRVRCPFSGCRSQLQP